MDELGAEESGAIGNVTVFAPAGTVTDVGILIAELLVINDTFTPPVGAD